ncbi:MAG: F-box protein, partial [Cytophagales bacterium]|nr:F-box protein [Cytophagales bacterium]
MNEKLNSFECLGLLDGYLNLPGTKEILMKVFGYFSVRQLVGAKLVCRKLTKVPVRYPNGSAISTLWVHLVIQCHVLHAGRAHPYTFFSRRGNDIEPKTMAGALRHVQFDTGQKLFKIFSNWIYCALSSIHNILVSLENGLAGSREPDYDPLWAMFEAAKCLGNSNPCKVTNVALANFDAKEGFNLAEEILEFLALLASG